MNSGDLEGDRQKALLGVEILIERVRAIKNSTFELNSEEKSNFLSKICNLSMINDSINSNRNHWG